jgi:hypothetical protein
MFLFLSLIFLYSTKKKQLSALNSGDKQMRFVMLAGTYRHNNNKNFIIKSIKFNWLLCNIKKFFSFQKRTLLLLLLNFLLCWQKKKFQNLRKKGVNLKKKKKKFSLSDR